MTEEEIYLVMHPDSLAAWYWRLARGKKRHWNAVVTAWRYGMGT